MQGFQGGKTVITQNTAKINEMLSILLIHMYVLSQCTLNYFQASMSVVFKNLKQNLVYVKECNNHVKP